MQQSGEQQSWFRRWLGPPQLATPELTLRARTFWIVAVGTLLIGTLSIGLLIVQQPETFERRAISTASLWVILAALLLINRQGSTRAASWFLVLGLIAFVTQRSWALGGIHAPVAPLYMAFAIMGSLLLGRAGAVASALAAMAAGTLLVVAEDNGWLPVPEAPITDTAELLFMGLSIGLALMLQDLVGRAMLRNLNRAETELGERNRAQARLGLALQAGKIGAWELELATRQMHADERVFELYGIELTPDRSLDFETWASRLHPEDRKIIEKRMASAVVGPARGIAEFRVVWPDGSVRHIQGASNLMPGGVDSPHRLVGVVMDVTDAVLAARERERLVHALGERVKELQLLHGAARLFQQHKGTNAELLQSLVALMPVAWQFPECCQARISYGEICTATDGWRESPWMQSIDFEAAGDRGRIEVAYTEARPDEAEGPFLKEERALLQSLREILVGHLELRKHQRELESLVATRTAELARSLDSLKQLERLRDDLVHMVVHDMRSPLMALIMSLDTANSKAPAELKKPLNTASRTADSLKRMANTLLDVSRLEAGRMPLERQRCDLVAMAAEVKNSLAVLDPQRVVELAGDATVEVECDRGLILRVIENLVSNGIKHTPSEGRLRIEVRKQADCAHVSVADEGQGVPAEARESIFEKFGAIATRKEQVYHSAGLGLAYCKLAVQAHSGKIGVDAGQPVGSVFWFELPL